MSFYPADLARIHDEGFGDFARAAACELLKRLRPSSRVVELGCGTGISSEILCQAGHDVIGIDLSPDMLAIARARAPHAQFRQGSVWDAEIPACSAVTAIGEVLNYAADSRAGEARLPGLLGRVRAALAAGGVFMFDVATPGRATAGVHVAEGSGWMIESRMVERDGALDRHMTISAGDGVREEVHRLQLYSAEAVESALRATGFALERLDRYCDFGFWPGYAAFAAHVS